MTEEVSAPKIEFPCERYPIKVIGNASEDFAEAMHELILRHAPECDFGTIVRRDSSNGRFHSVQFLITATSIEQLEALHADLKASGRVHMVL